MLKTQKQPFGNEVIIQNIFFENILRNIGINFFKRQQKNNKMLFFLQ